MNRMIALHKYRKLTVAFLLLTIYSIRLAAQSSCQFGNTGDVFFQTYSSATVQSTGSVQVTCPSGISYTIALSAGTTAGATITNRMMVRNTDGATLGYQLFSDPAYTINWGNSAGTNWVSRTGTGGQDTMTIYGQIPGGEAFFLNANGNNFSDTVTATLAWPGGQTARTFTVKLQQVSPGCGIGASPLNFGNYTGATLRATTTIQIACTGGDAYNVGLNAGTGTGATIATREMTGPGGAELSYKLFSDSGYTTNWGNTIGTDTVKGTETGTGGISTLTVYGQIPAGQSPTPGTYTDTIIATLTY